MPAAWVAGAAALGGALASYDSAGNASKKQQEGTDKAIVSTNAQSSLTRSDLQPYRQAGTSALARLQTLLGLGDPNQAARDSAAAAAGLKKPTWDDAAAAHLAWHMQKYGTGYTAGSDMAAKEQQTQAMLDQMTTDYNNKVAQLVPSTAPGATGGAPSDFGELTRKFSTDDLNADPVYNSGLKFGLDEGTKALERRSAASGGYDSGAELKALTRFGNDYGSTKAADSYSRFRDFQDSTYGKLSGVAGMGTGATSVGVNAGTAAGSNLAALQSGQGNAAAAAAIAQGNSFNNAANTASQYALLRQLTGGGQRTTTAANPNLTGAGDLGAVA